MFRWSDEKTMSFIKSYREQSCLWDSSDPLYKSQVARDSSYELLQRQMNDPNLDIKTIKVKIKNLRTTYHQQLKMIRNSGGSYKPALVWFDEMDSFLGNTVEIRRLSSRETMQTVQQSEKEDDQSEFYEVQSETDQVKEEADKEFNNDTERPKKLRVYEALDPGPITRRVEAIIDPLRLTEDEFHYFGLNVAAQLRNLPLKRALKMQADIMNMLYRVRTQAHFEEAPEDREVYGRV